MYQRAETRAELDEGRHDPFAHEFQHLFNDRDFIPSPLEPVDGIVGDLLDTFDPGLHPFPRDGTTLKQRWTRLRSLYTVACNNFEKSGQSDADIFPSFTQGDDSLCYMHCVFKDHLSIEAVLRSIPRHARGESGVEEITRTRSTVPSEAHSGRKIRRDDGLLDIAQVVKQMATEHTAPIPIIIQHSPGNLGSYNGSGSRSQAVSGTKVNPSCAETVATVRDLLDLERQLREDLKRLQTVECGPVDDEDMCYKSLRLRLLRKTRKSIAKHMSTLNEDDSSGAE